MYLRPLLSLLLLCGAIGASQGQSIVPTVPFTVDTLYKKVSSFTQGLSDTAQKSWVKLEQVPNRYFNVVRAKSQKFNRRITQHTEKALRRLQRQEEKISRKLGKFDSLAAHNLLATSIDSLSHLRETLKGKVSNLSGKIPGRQYIPYLDTLKSSLNFLDKYSGKLDGIPLANADLSGK
jgi:hypothetical protein